MKVEILNGATLKATAEQPGPDSAVVTVREGARVVATMTIDGGFVSCWGRGDFWAGDRGGVLYDHAVDQPRQRK